MNGAITAIIAENVILLAAISAGYRLLKQGGGVQVKPVPVPKPNGTQDNGGKQ